MSLKALQRRGREAREWLMEACFPLWADRGVGYGGFLEALDLQHRSLESPKARLRVQARQTYVFTAAASLQWDRRRSDHLVDLGTGMLTQCRQENGLFSKGIDLEQQKSVDPVTDLYDTAFALFALSHAHAYMRTKGDATGQAAVRDDANRLLKAIDTHLAHLRGGYKEALPAPDLRKQNPHMHFFEALLAASNLIGDEHFLARANELNALCHEHFIDPETGTIGEFFNTDDWSPPEGESGSVVEPGHQFEWVWLFGQLAKVTGTELPDTAKKMYAFACSTLDGAGRVILSCLRDGTPVDRGRRTWPQTEALKAHLTMWKWGDEAALARAIASFDVLMDEHLTPEGGWIDRYDADGHVVAQTMPASTGYHVVLAFMELIKLTET